MIDLTSLNTLRIPAKTKTLLEIDSTEKISLFSRKPGPLLGQGANILLRTPVFDTVAVNKLTGFKIIRDTQDSVDVEFASGHDWHEAVMWSVGQNLSGLENMAYIPGTVGAAPLGNIGAYGGNQEDIFISLNAVDLSTGKTQPFTKPEMKFAYRESIFKHKLAGKYFITSVTYRLSKTAHLETSYHSRYESLAGELTKIRPINSAKPYTVAEVAQAVINLRRSKLPDINELGSAGSFFKNPTVSKSIYLGLKSRLSGFQGYPPGNNQYQNESEWLDSVNEVKISAGRLLDELGWKGKRIENVGTFDKHALIIVNHGGASGQEIYEFAENMRSDVLGNFRVNLEYEVIII